MHDDVRTASSRLGALRVIPQARGHVPADRAGAPGHTRDENRATIRLPNLRLRTIERATLPAMELPSCGRRTIWRDSDSRQNFARACRAPATERSAARLTYISSTFSATPSPMRQ